jgi:hypothetical protein
MQFLKDEKCWFVKYLDNFIETQILCEKYSTLPFTYKGPTIFFSTIAKF